MFRKRPNFWPGSLYIPLDTWSRSNTECWRHIWKPSAASFASYYLIRRASGLFPSQHFGYWVNVSCFTEVVIFGRMNILTTLPFPQLT